VVDLVVTELAVIAFSDGKAELTIPGNFCEMTL